MHGRLDSRGAISHLQHPSLSLKDTAMTLTLELMPLLALVAGILILVAPKFLNLIVAIFLIVYGVVGLFNL